MDDIYALTAADNVAEHLYSRHEYMAAASHRASLSIGTDSGILPLKILDYSYEFMASGPVRSGSSVGLLAGFLTFNPSTPSIVWDPAVRERGLFSTTSLWETKEKGPLGEMEPIRSQLTPAMNKTDYSDSHLYFRTLNGRVTNRVLTLAPQTGLEHSSGLWPASGPDVKKYYPSLRLPSFWDNVEDGTADADVVYDMMFSSMYGGVFPEMCIAPYLVDSKWGLTSFLNHVGVGLDETYTKYVQRDDTRYKDKKISQGDYVFAHGWGIQREAVLNYQIRTDVWCAGTHHSVSGEISNWDTYSYGFLDGFGRVTKTLTAVAVATWMGSTYILSMDGHIYRSLAPNPADLEADPTYQDLGQRVDDMFIAESIQIGFSNTLQFLYSVREIWESDKPKLVLEYRCLVDNTEPDTRVGEWDAVRDSYSGEGDSEWVSSSDNIDPTRSYDTYYDGHAAAMQIATWGPLSPGSGGNVISTAEKFAGAIGGQVPRFDGWGEVFSTEVVPCTGEPFFGEYLPGTYRPAGSDNWNHDYVRRCRFVITDGYSVEVVRSYREGIGEQFKDAHAGFTIDREGDILEAVGSCAEGVTLLFRTVEASYNNDRTDVRSNLVRWEYGTRLVDCFYFLSRAYPVYVNTTTSTVNVSYKETCTFKSVGILSPYGEVDLQGNIFWVYPSIEDLQCRIPSTELKYTLVFMGDSWERPHSVKYHYDGGYCQGYSKCFIEGNTVKIVASDPFFDTHSIVKNTIDMDIEQVYRDEDYTFYDYNPIQPLYTGLGPSYVSIDAILESAEQSIRCAMQPEAANHKFEFRAQHYLHCAGRESKLGPDIHHSGDYTVPKGAWNLTHMRAQKILYSSPERERMVAVSPGFKADDWDADGVAEGIHQTLSSYSQWIGVTHFYPRAFFNDIVLDFRYIPEAFIRAAIK